MQQFIETLNGLSGLAALLNGLLLWPIVRILRHNDTRHDERLKALEAARNK